MYKPNTKPLIRLLAVAIGFAAVHCLADESATRSANTGAVHSEMAADGVQRLQITLDSYKFTPAHIVVEAGMPVEITLKNEAVFAPHNFRIDAPDEALNISQDLSPGATAIVSFTPPHPGMYEFYCDKKLPFAASHRDKGMSGLLEVR
jgi:plastocyanin